jgi:putative ABC transport system permease protein
LDKVHQNPAVLSASVARTYPLNETAPFTTNFQIDGRPEPAGQPQLKMDVRSVTPGYFRMMGISFERGRDFLEGDSMRAPVVAIINRTMAAHYWAGEDPIGHRVLVAEGKRSITIVGVVGDVAQYGPDKPAADELYVPFAQNVSPVASLLVRTREDPTPLMRQLVASVYAIDPEQPVARIRTIEQLRSQTLAPPRLTSLLLGCFAALALIITAAGIAGVMGLSVSQRIKEIGVRMALGANRAHVLRMVLLQGLSLIAAGLAAGFALSLAGTRVMSGLLFRVQPDDPATLAGVTLLFLVIGGLACYGPARRATLVDPLKALRSE